jgi:hypothetical protein
MAWDRRAALRDPRQWQRPLLLTVGAPVCLLLTPYGLHSIAYYHDTLFNSALKNAVTEWAPITSEPLIAWPFFVLAAVAVWSFGRASARTTLWDRLALLALALVSINVIRNVVFFALCAIVLVPVSLNGIIASRIGRDVKVRPRVNALAVTAVLLTVVIAGVATLTRPARRYELSYQRLGVLAAVKAVTQADPTVKVIADVRFADWLLWRDPALRGRIANDARFELLTGAQIERIRRVFAALGTDWERGATGYRLVVIDRDAAPEGARGFDSEPGRRILYNDGRRMVILRSAQEANS